MMDVDESFQLDMWKGDWGLPSVDVDCLHILTYAKISGVPLKVKATNNPFKTINGHLPVLRHGHIVADDISEILRLFRGNNYNSDFALSPKECAEVTAYNALLKEKLYPALQFIWWVDEKNLNGLIRPWYCKALPFPINMYYPGYYERRAKALMESLFPTEKDISSIENAVYSEAQKCITLLSIRLGDSDYFGGTNKNALDAAVYAYLAPLLKTPLPNPALQNHLKACENLVKFISRITRHYFEAESKQYEKMKSEKNNQKMGKASESDFPNRRRDQIIAGVVATIAMIGYALSTGLFEVSQWKDELSSTATHTYNEEEDDE